MKNSITLFVFTALWLGAAQINAQTAGCTDPLANNFNANATENDGSCLYNASVLSSLLLHKLPDDLNECSGLVVKDGQWWSLNDGGNDPQLLRINPADGSVLQRIRLLNATNVDWEDLTIDDEAFYIGDFGNNATGNRMDLGIYRLPFWAVTEVEYLEVSADDYEFWPINYVDQIDFTPAANENELVYDCEAMIRFNGEMHFFTKNWTNRTTSHYTLAADASTAQFRSTFDVDGLISGAAISPDSQVVMLTGYETQSTTSVFVWLLWDFEGDNFFSGNKRRLELGNLLAQGQCEAVAFSDLRQGLLGSERLAFGSIELAPPTLRAFDISPYIIEPGTNSTDASVKSSLRIWPNPTQDILYWEGATTGRFEVFNVLGQSMIRGDLATQRVDLSSFQPGNYRLVLIGEQESMSYWVVRQ
jgi:hypothetical protein